MNTHHGRDGRFTSGSTMRAAKAILGPSFGVSGGRVTIAGRKATMPEIVSIRHMRAVNLHAAHMQRSGARQHDAFIRGLNKSTRASKPKVHRISRR